MVEVRRKGRDPRRDLHAVDVSLAPLLRGAGGDGQHNARRLLVLAQQPYHRGTDGDDEDEGGGSLCRGLIYEVGLYKLRIQLTHTLKPPGFNS
jgi:hypothetical protein